MSEIREGKAGVLLADENDVFYNKAQVVNRDISIAVIKTFAKKRQEELDANAKHMKVRYARWKKKSKGGGQDFWLSFWPPVLARRWGAIPAW